MLVFGKVCDFGGLEAAIDDRRQRVETTHWLAVLVRRALVGQVRLVGDPERPPVSHHSGLAVSYQELPHFCPERGIELWSSR